MRFLSMFYARIFAGITLGNIVEKLNTRDLKSSGSSEINGFQIPCIYFQHCLNILQYLKITTNKYSLAREIFFRI